MSDVAKKLNRGLKATKKASKNLSKVLLQKDPLEWRLKATREGLDRLVRHIKVEADDLLWAITDKDGKGLDYIDYNAARFVLSNLSADMMKISSFLGRIQEMESIKAELATARKK